MSEQLRAIPDIAGHDLNKPCPARELDRFRADIVQGFQRMQEIVGDWQNRAHPDPEDGGVQPRYERMALEGHEFAEAVICSDGSPESRREIEDEAADVVIGIMGVVIAAGGNLAPAIGRKLGAMFAKYDPCELEKLRAQGMNAEEAMKHRKTLYDSKNHNPAI